MEVYVYFKGKMKSKLLTDIVFLCEHWTSKNLKQS